jgi:hypothetical protein
LFGGSVSPATRGAAPNNVQSGTTSSAPEQSLPFDFFAPGELGQSFRKAGCGAILRIVRLYPVDLPSIASADQREGWLSNAMQTVEQSEAAGQ